jgi:hypothetical protein
MTLPTPGRYVLTWGGYSQVVTVLVWKGELIFRPKSGWDRLVSSVPDAKWEAVR